MSLRAKKPSLAEKISNLVTAAPTIFGSDDENEETRAKVVEQYDEIESDDETTGSKFRKQNVDLLDQIDNRYKGKKISRKDAYAMEDESEASDIDDEESASSKEEDSKSEKSAEDDDSESVKSAEDDEIGTDGEESNSDVEQDSEIDVDNPLRRQRGEETNFANIAPTNIHADVEKGNCVREQLKIWENLLEVRIKLQKCLIGSNKMPQADVYQEFKRSDQRFKKEADVGRTKLGGLLENLLEMQRNLLDNYSETRNLLKRGEKRKATEIAENEESDEEICSDTEDETNKEEDSAKESSNNDEEEALSDKKKKRRKKQSLADYEKLLADNHELYRDYRNSVIQKWNDKTRVASGSLNKSSSQSIVKQIEFLLGDRTKLLKRTRLKRSDYVILGKEGSSSQDDEGRRTQDYDSEIYDDDDFYHQLLRELIEYKSSGVTDPVQLSKQWIALQNMRNKMKRKIDTRATKGRRVRYNVHTKLINFMAPVNDNDTWSDLAKNELYNSLFGKIKTAQIETTANVESGDK